jgi:threonine synthase
VHTNRHDPPLFLTRADVHGDKPHQIFPGDSLKADDLGERQRPEDVPKRPGIPREANFFELPHRAQATECRATGAARSQRSPPARVFAAAAYAAAAGLPCRVAIPEDTPEAFAIELAAFGAEVRLVPGTIADCGRVVSEWAPAPEWWNVATFKEPFRLEGKKTLGYEIAEQLDWTLPDVIVYPTGGGTGLIGMWKAFEELEQMGLVAPGKRPRMVAVQAMGCRPVVAAFEAGATRATPWDKPRTYASGLRVPASLGDTLILQALTESGGTAIAVSDDEMAEAQLELARGEGVFACPEGGATWAAARKLVAAEFIAPTDVVVLFNTGTGLKYPKVPGLRVP